MVQLIPYVFTRIASGSLIELDCLQLDIHPFLSTLEKGIQQKKEHQDALNEQLFGLIAQAGDPKQQNTWLNLKRAIHNNRLGAMAKWVEQSPHSLAELTEGVRQYIRLAEEITGFEQAFEQTYQTKLRTHRTYLQGLATNEWLQKGLRLSSKTLFNQSKSFGLALPAQFKNREYQIELGLLRYLTRQCFKTSPFSTFTYLALTTLGEMADVLQHPRTTDTVQSHVRLNNYVFAYLKTLLTQNPELRNWWPLRLNSSLRQTDGQYTFLMNYNNVEAFQTLPASEMLQILTEVFAEHGSEMALLPLTQVLTDGYVDASEETLEKYLLKLVEVGYLEFQVGGSGMNPHWDRELRQHLQALPVRSPLVTDVIAALSTLRNIANEYVCQDSSSRNTLLEKAYEVYSGLCDALLQPLGWSNEALLERSDYQASYLQQYQNTAEFAIKPNLRANFTTESLFYEDAYSTQTLIADQVAVQAYVNKLDTFGKHLVLFDPNFEERAKLAHHFALHYPTQTSVHLLEFYRSYYQCFKKPEKERLENQAMSADSSHGQGLLGEPVIPAIAMRRQQQQQWLTAFMAVLPENFSTHDMPVDITRETLQAADAAIGGPIPGPDTYAAGAFVQFYNRNTPSETALYGVVNGLFTGMGRSNGRFLHLFDEKVTETFRQWNQRLNTRDLLAELNDASYFNANIHPPLLPFEISLPGGHANLPESQQIAVKDMAVQWDEQAEAVSLWHTLTGKKIHCFDLCLQATATRSELYQLLASFGDTIADTWTPLVRAIYEVYQSTFPERVVLSEGLLTYPRICFEQHVILQRKSWYIRKEAVPQRFRTPSESDSQYFLRLNQWRLQMTIPEEVFMHLHSGFRPVAAETEQKPEQQGKDDYKPQYIRFTAPLLVRLFEKQLEKMTQGIRLEEMLPDSQTVRNQGIVPTKERANAGNAYVTEQLLQWYQFSE